MQQGAAMAMRYILTAVPYCALLLLQAAMGLADCIEHKWRDAAIYVAGDEPVMVGRAYGRVSRHLLREELLKRLVTYTHEICIHWQVAASLCWRHHDEKLVDISM